MKKREIILGLGFLVVFFLSVYFDNKIFGFISIIRSNLLNEFFLKIEFISSAIVLAFFLIGLFIWRKNKRRWLVALIASMGMSVVISFLLKFSIQRFRPFQLGIISILPELEKASHWIWNFSFPSFHTMIAFCTIPFLSKEFPKFKYFWISFAVLIAFSRIYLGMHFLSDVLAGGFIGYLIGVTILKLEEENKIFEKIKEKVLRR